MNYVIELPKTKNGNRYILVITDRLCKGLIFIPVMNLNSETLARKFIQHFIAYHALPSAIISNRGDQFIKGI